MHCYFSSAFSFANTFHHLISPLTIQNPLLHFLLHSKHKCVNTKETCNCPCLSSWLLDWTSAWADTVGCVFNCRSAPGLTLGSASGQTVGPLPGALHQRQGLAAALLHRMVWQVCVGKIHLRMVMQQCINQYEKMMEKTNRMVALLEICKTVHLIHLLFGYSLGLKCMSFFLCVPIKSDVSVLNTVFFLCFFLMSTDYAPITTEYHQRKPES